MTGAVPARILALLLVLLVSGITTELHAQRMDVLRGRVTNADGQPLSGVRVTATSVPGNVTRQARTDGKGNYRIVFSEGTGDYMVAFALIGYVQRTTEVKRLAAEDVLIANMSLRIVDLDTVSVEASSVRRRVKSHEAAKQVSNDKELDANAVPFEQRGEILALVASQPGVRLVPGVDGERDGFSVFGLSADQNTVTLNGLPFDMASLPRDVQFNSSFTTTSYDVSRGGFSGANVDFRVPLRGNQIIRGMNASLNLPQLVWSDRASRALGSEYTNISLGGTAGGAWLKDRHFYNLTYQFAQKSQDNTSLLKTNAFGLQAAGISADSVNRLVSILQQGGMTGLSGRQYANRVSRSGSLLGSLGWDAVDGSFQSVKVTMNGSWSGEKPINGGVTQFASASGERTNRSGAVQVRHSSYLGMLLSETGVSFNTSRAYGRPYSLLPAGNVRVTSDLPDRLGSVRTLTFGGNQGLAASSSSMSTSFQNSLSWFDDGNKHRLTLSTDINYGTSEQDPSSNLRGTFVFNSLADLEAGTPASFSRMVRVQRRFTRTANGSIALGDSYRHSDDLQVQFGVRADAVRYLRRPDFNNAVEATFGRRNNHVPGSVAISPRIGFQQVLGLPDTARNAKPHFLPRPVLTGGVGLYVNAPSSSLGSVLESTGLPSGDQQISCVGPAAPVANWTQFASDPATIPAQCADGTAGTVFANAAPGVTLYSPAFKAPRSLRTELTWNGAVFRERYYLNASATYALNLNQERTVDLNFDDATRFNLGDDGRPVFVQSSSIVPSSGSIATSDARVSTAFARVDELRSDLQSRVAQVSVQISPTGIGLMQGSFSWSLGYAYSYLREQVPGFTNTAGNPFDVEWSSSAQGPHRLTYSLRPPFLRKLNLSLNGSLTSPTAYTPMIVGDVNGDGYSNDRAFIYSATSTTDSALLAGMDALLATSPSARKCLSRLLDHIAPRNSCQGPWTFNTSLGISVTDRYTFRLPHRASFSFSISNPLGALDMLLHSNGELRGWGDNAYVDPSLLYVRGFDPATQRYKYEVNQRFGVNRREYSTTRSPVVITLFARIDLGPTEERQILNQSIKYGFREFESRDGMGMLRTISGISSDPIMSLRRLSDTLKLTIAQADSLAVLNRQYWIAKNAVFGSTAHELGTIPDSANVDVLYERLMRARREHIDVIINTIAAAKELLTPAQRRKMPRYEAMQMETHYLQSLREGTGTYLDARNRGGL